MPAALARLALVLAAAGERRDHAQAALHQPRADARAHGALRNHRNCRIHDDIPQIGLDRYYSAGSCSRGMHVSETARLRRRHHRRRPLRADARHRARPPRHSGHRAGRKDLAGAVPGRQRHPGAHHGALPAAGLRREGARPGPAARLSDRHRLFHPLHQARTGPLQPAVGARGARDGQDADRLLERGRTAASRLADVRRGRAARRGRGAARRFRSGRAGA